MLNFYPLVLLGSFFFLLKTLKFSFENFVCGHFLCVIFTPSLLLIFIVTYICIYLIESIQFCSCVPMSRADDLGLDNHKGLIPGGKCFYLSQQPLPTCSNSCRGGLLGNILCPHSPESCLPTPSLTPRLSIYLKSIYNKLLKSLLHNLPFLLSLLRSHSGKYGQVICR